MPPATSTLPSRSQRGRVIVAAGLHGPGGSPGSADRIVELGRVRRRAGAPRHEHPAIGQQRGRVRRSAARACSRWRPMSRCPGRTTRRNWTVAGIVFAAPPPTTSTRPSRSSMAMCPGRGVIIVPGGGPRGRPRCNDGRARAGRWTGGRARAERRVGRRAGSADRGLVGSRIRRRRHRPRSRR